MSFMGPDGCHSARAEVLSIPIINIALSSAISVNDFLSNIPLSPFFFVMDIIEP
jgi:hypothetical protein